MGSNLCVGFWYNLYIHTSIHIYIYTYIYIYTFIDLCVYIYIKQPHLRPPKNLTCAQLHLDISSCTMYKHSHLGSTLGGHGGDLGTRAWLGRDLGIRGKGVREGHGGMQAGRKMGLWFMGWELGEGRVGGDLETRERG